jgi:hypothetical protein
MVRPSTTDRHATLSGDVRGAVDVIGEMCPACRRTTVRPRLMTCRCLQLCKCFDLRIMDRPLMRQADFYSDVICESPEAIGRTRLAIFAMVPRLQPVVACIELQDWPVPSMTAIPALRPESSARPL